MGTITTKQARMLRRIIGQAPPSGHVWIHEADKAAVDSIMKDHPDALTWLYGGLAQTVGDHVGCCRLRVERAACDLLTEYEAQEIVGYEGRASVVEQWLKPVEFDFHYRAKSIAGLRAQLKRAHGGREVTIIEARPLTHGQWVRSYGWGRM